MRARSGPLSGDPARNEARRLLRLVFFLLLLAPGCASAGTSDLRWVTVEEIVSSLPDHPVAVGFDIDDTVLFSSPGYFYGLTNRDGPHGTNRYGEDPLSSPEFWSDMNSRFDRFSLPKAIGRVLLDLHKARGDRIYFITARTASPEETLTPLLNRTFGLENTHAVIFVGRDSKAHPLRDLGIELYYGDADHDND